MKKTKTYEERNIKNYMLDIGIVLALAIIVIIRTNGCTTIEIIQDANTQGYCTTNTEGCLIYNHTGEGYQWEYYEKYEDQQQKKQKEQSVNLQNISYNNNTKH